MIKMMMMMKFVVCFVMVTAVVAHGHKHHPKFPIKNIEDFIVPVPKKVTCTTDMRNEREEIIEQSKCGEPKEIFEYLKMKSPHESVSPRAVWVKRCVGLCEYDSDGTCVPTETKTRHIPIRIYNAKTNKETCAMYPIEEHVSCGCCALSPEECASPRVYNPRKCSCQCPNLAERRKCLKKPNQNMRWNRSKCACEPKKRRG